MHSAGYLSLKRSSYAAHRRINASLPRFLAWYSLSLRAEFFRLPNSLNENDSRSKTSSIYLESLSGSRKGYVSDSWSTDEFSVVYLGRGFISAYAQDEDREDFAEMVSLYITNTAEQWEKWMEEAAKTTNEDGETGRQLIEKKLEIVRAYMHESWNIDLDDMRTEIHRRQNDVISGKIDLTDLNVN